MGFANETTVKAVRKSHICDGCGTKIAIGEPAIRWSGTTDGDFSSVIFHPECREAEIALNHEHDIRFSDEWMSMRLDMEPDDWPWMVAHHPIVAERMNLLAKIAEYEAEYGKLG